MNNDLKMQEASNNIKSNPQKAVELLNEILKDNPQDINAIYCKGLAMFNLKSFQESVNCFSEVLKLNPNTFQAHLNISNIAISTNNPEQALASFVGAVNCNKELLGELENWITNIALLACRISLSQKTKDKEQALKTIGTVIRAYNLMSQHPEKNISDAGNFNQGSLKLLTVDLAGVDDLKKCGESEIFAKQSNALIKLSELEDRNEIKEKTFIFHSGIHNTDTTWFQSTVFPKMPGINHVGETFFSLYNSKGEVKAHFGLPTEKSTGLSNRIISKPFDKEEFNSLFSDNECVLSLSDESKWVAPEDVAKRLQEIQESTGVKTKLLLFVRNQKDVVKSAYTQSLKNKKIPNLNIKEVYDSGLAKLSDYDYMKVYNAFEEMIKEERALILPFEMLKENKTETLTKIADFYGVSESSLFAEYAADIPAVDEISEEIEKLADSLSPDLEEFTSEVLAGFKESNREFEEKTSIPLSKYGYC
jgi:tetratricopeptide (TPR) repeat protein